MSLFGKRAKIDGLDFGTAIRGVNNGTYIIVFEREFASLEQVEAINWSKPTIEGDTILPKEYGYEVEGITYSSCDQSYRVTVRVGRQYLGDVTEYQERIDELRQKKTDLSEQNATKQTEIHNLEQQLAEADETAINLYEQLAAKSAPAEAGEESGEEETA